MFGVVVCKGVQSAGGYLLYCGGRTALKRLCCDDPQALSRYLRRMWQSSKLLLRLEQLPRKWRKLASPPVRRLLLMQHPQQPRHPMLLKNRINHIRKRCAYAVFNNASACLHHEIHSLHIHFRFRGQAAIIRPPTDQTRPCYSRPLPSL